MEKKLFLLDGHSLIFKMYYAFLRRPMVNSKHQDVSILYGFTKYVLELVEREKPTHIAVAFDPPGKTFRHKLYPEYKGTRQATPELVIEALQPLIQICGALQIPVLMVPGFEGDDVLGSMAVRSSRRGFDVYMVTPDKDFGQLIGPHIIQYKPGKAGEAPQIVGQAELCEKYGISAPSQIIDMLTLCGDTADNVPGVQGVGEVGASKLISRYGSVENIYAHLNELSERQRGLFIQAQDHVALSKQLVTIKTDIPLDDISDEDMAIPAAARSEAARLFDQYEFPSLKKFLKLSPQDAAQIHNRAQEGEQAAAPQWQEVSPAQLCEQALAQSRVTLQIDTNTLTAVAGSLACNAAPEAFRAILQDEAVSKCGIGLKPVCSFLLDNGIELKGFLEDAELMHYLVDPERSHKLETLCKEYLGIDLDAPLQDQKHSEEPPDLFAVGPQEEEERTEPRYLRAAATSILCEKVRQDMVQKGLEGLYRDIEEPLVRVLCNMEREGVRVDLASLEQYAQSLRTEMAQIEARVRQMASCPQLNLSSPRQVGKLLFEDLRIDPRMKVRADGKYPTDEETLQNYAEANPIIGELLEYRAVRKLLSTYIEPFGDFVSPYDGRIHTTFNQALTATGRLSSSKPNLQNIPIRTERGRMIRQAFVGGSQEEDKVIVSADYSQIELRLMAHFSGDENMLDAFRRGEDVHSMTASKIFGVPQQEVTSDMRRSAKTANFGIIYGISSFGLAQRLKIPRVAAKKLIEDYFASFPTVQSWIEKTKAEAASCGYVQTLFGRRRYLPDINSGNATVRGFAERNAINAPIQGTAADIIKIAMVRIHRRFKELNIRSRMILQVHDELNFSVVPEEREQVERIVIEEMQGAYQLNVPLIAEYGWGSNWLEAH